MAHETRMRSFCFQFGVPRLCFKLPRLILSKKKKKTSYGLSQICSTTSFISFHVRHWWGIRKKEKKKKWPLHYGGGIQSLKSSWTLFTFQNFIYLSFYTATLRAFTLYYLLFPTHCSSLKVLLSKEPVSLFAKKWTAPEIAVVGTEIDIYSFPCSSCF